MPKFNLNNDDITRFPVVAIAVIRTTEPEGRDILQVQPLAIDPANEFDMSESIDRNSVVVGVIPPPPGMQVVCGDLVDGRRVPMGYEIPGLPKLDWSVKLAEWNKIARQAKGVHRDE